MTRPPRSRPDYAAWTEIATRWADNDAYGHVNNTVHYGWFDTAVNGWLIGQGLLDVERGDPIGLVVETGCRYFAPLSFPGPVDVGLAVEHVGRSSVRYRLGVFPMKAAEAAAEGHFVHVYVDRENRRPAEIPASWRERLEAIWLKG